MKNPRLKPKVIATGISKDNVRKTMADLRKKGYRKLSSLKNKRFFSIFYKYKVKVKK